MRTLKEIDDLAEHAISAWETSEWMDRWPTPTEWLAVTKALRMAKEALEVVAGPDTLAEQNHEAFGYAAYKRHRAVAEVTLPSIVALERGEEVK